MLLLKQRQCNLRTCLGNIHSGLVTHCTSKHKLCLPHTSHWSFEGRLCTLLMPECISYSVLHAYSMTYVMLFCNSHIAVVHVMLGRQLNKTCSFSCRYAAANNSANGQAVQAYRHCTNVAWGRGTWCMMYTIWTTSWPGIAAGMHSSIWAKVWEEMAAAHGRALISFYTAALSSWPTMQTNHFWHWCCACCQPAVDSALAWITKDTSTAISQAWVVLKGLVSVVDVCCTISLYITNHDHALHKWVAQTSIAHGIAGCTARSVTQLRRYLYRFLEIS